MTVTASIFDDHWNVTKISALPHRRFNPDFHGNADDGKGIDAAIAQREVEGRALKRRHGDLIEDGLARQGMQLGNLSEPRRVPQEPWLDLVWRLHPLPGHRRAELSRAHEFSGE